MQHWGYLCADFFKRQMRTRSGNSVNKDRKNLGAAWQWGRENMRGWPVGENPFLAVARKPEIRKPRYVPPESDFWAVFDYVAGKAAETGEDVDIQDRVMLLAYLHLAARRSELFKAKWSDIDFSRGLIRLWTRKREGGTLEYDQLPMSTELTAELKMWAKRRLGHGTKGPRKNNFPFYPSRLQAIFARSEGAKSSKELAIPPVLRSQIEQI
jgi:integrase